MRQCILLLIGILITLSVPDHGRAYTIFLWPGGYHPGTSYPKMENSQSDLAWPEDSLRTDYHQDEGCSASAGASGRPVFWDTTSVEFVFGLESEDLYYGYQEDAVEDAIDTWEDAVSNTYLEVTYGGNTNNDLDVEDGVNTITFGDWGGLTSSARTLFRLSTSEADSGQIQEVDIILSDDKFWTTSSYVCGTDTADIQSVVTHELGHALGLGHTCDGCMPTMKTYICTYCPTQTEALELRSLETDDTDGLKEIYGPGNGDGIYVRSEAGSAKPVVRTRVEPTSFRLLTSYPNPFNPVTTIHFELRRGARVSVVVYDAAGQVVDKVLTDEFLLAGEHSFTWDAGKAASGIYVVELRTPSWSTSKKMTLLR